jgi:TPR repeat protein
MPAHALHLLIASGMAMLPTVAHADARTSAGLDAVRAEAQSYEHGEGVPKDPFRAVELYCEAARQGDAESQYDLGWMYANGRGVDRDDTIAAAYFQLAANQGQAQARAMLDHLPPPGTLPQCIDVAVPLAEYDDEPPASPPSQYVIIADDVFVPVSPAQEKIVKLVRAIAPEFNVDPMLALAFIRAESNFDASARSSRNAQGLMQLIPETSARFNVGRPYDPAQNIRGGLAYVRWLLAYFQGNVPLVAAAYNAGEGTVERYRGIPPYAETREYVKRIIASFRSSTHPYDPMITDASPELGRMRPVKAGDLK